MRPRAVDLATVRELRAAVLRPGMPAESSVWPGDEAPDTVHAAVLDGDRVLGVASVIREPFPHGGGPDDWRVRGMATHPAARGRGIGAALLEMCIEHARAEGGIRVWCNARVGARTLYERAGMRAVGAEFEIAGIGPHVLMCLSLRPSP